MKHYRFSIIIERDRDGYFVSCPELQGCHSQGDTYEEALENIRDAVRLHVADRIARREPISQSQAISLSILEVPA